MERLKDDMAALKSHVEKVSRGRYEEGESSRTQGRQFRPYNKIEFPAYSDGDPRGWILKAEKYFRYYNIPEEEKVDVASMHLEGSVLDLFSWLSADQEIAYWEGLVHVPQKNFRPAEFQNPDEYLCSIKQSGSVQEYRQEFAKRSSRVSGWPDHCLLGIFLNGLKDELKADVRIHKPRTVHKAMSLAIEFEEKNKQVREKSNIHSAVSGKLGVEEHHSTYTTASTNATQKPQLRISEQKKQSRFSRGECFRCGEKYGLGHRCKTSSLQLLEADKRHTDAYVDGEELVEEVAEISLHAIMGMPHHATLIVRGYINSFKVSILIDCGSTHNFINDSLIPKIGLSTHEVASSVVTDFARLLQCI